MRHFLYVLAFIVGVLNFHSLWAQNSLVARGLIRDENDAPVALAVVLAIQPQDSSIVAHTVTNTARLRTK